MAENTTHEHPMPDAVSGVLADASADSPSAIRLTLSTPLYRGSAVAMFLSGLGASAAVPQVSSFLVGELGASLTAAGLYYLTSLTAPVAGYLVGSRSDRTGRRLGLFRLCALAGFLGWLGIAFSTQLWMPFVISAVVLGFALTATSQLFAAVHDELSTKPRAHNDGVVAIVRMALTAGWVAGPALGALIAAQTGPRVVLVVAALCTLAQILPLGTLRTPVVTRVRQAVDAEPVHPRPGFRIMMPLLAFTALFVCVYAGEPVKYAYLPIYMNDELHLPAAVSGAIIAVQPLVELILMPVAVLVARRTGMFLLMTVAACFGVGANLLFAFTGTAAGMFAGQILMGGVWGVFAALGIIVAQRLLPTAVATGSAIFFNSSALASALGGIAGGIGAAVVGLPLVFLVPAAFGAVAVIGLARMSRSRAARGL